MQFLPSWRPRGLAPPDLRGTLVTALQLPAEQDPQTGQANRAAVRQFLANVAIRLRADLPPLDFKWSALDDTVRADALGLLIERISENTVVTPPPAANTTG